MMSHPSIDLSRQFAGGSGRVAVVTVTEMRRNLESLRFTTPLAGPVFDDRRPALFVCRGCRKS